MCVDVRAEEGNYQAQ
jgi:hypothetical protein